MNDISSIITSDIVRQQNDMYWEENTIAAGLDKRPVLILISSSSYSSEDEAGLKRLLHASMLLPQHYNIIHLHANVQIAWHVLSAQLQPKVVLLFGIMPVQLGISAMFQLNSINHFSNCIWIPALPINTWDTEPEMKKQMWTNGWKPLFIDKTEGDMVNQ